MPIVSAQDAFDVAIKWQRDHPQPKSPEMLDWEAAWYRKHGAEYDRLLGPPAPGKLEDE